MGYTKYTWTDRVVQYAARYLLSLVSGTTYDFTAVPGTVTNVGSYVSASIMNNIESGIEASHKGTHIYGASSTGNDTYVIAFTVPFTSYNTGMIINFKPDTSNTGTANLNIDGLGAKIIKKFTASGKVDISTGDIIANGIYTVIYDGTDFILTAPTAIPSSLLTAQGDIIYASGANTPAKLDLTANSLLKSNSTVPTWLPFDATAKKAVISSGSDIVFGFSADAYYVASDNVIMTANTERSTQNGTLKTFKPDREGTFRLKGQFHNTSSNTATITIKNGEGTSLGTATTNSNTYVNFSIDTNASISLGDTINVYGQCADGSGMFIRNVTCCGTETGYFNIVTQD